MIHVQLIRQAYERRELAELKWISGDANPAGAMTKPQGKACDALTKLIDTNEIHLKGTPKGVVQSQKTRARSVDQRVRGPKEPEALALCVDSAILDCAGTC